MSTHHRIDLPSPWEHHEATDVSLWLDAPSEDADIRRRMQGRGTLNFSCGPFDLYLRPTAPELRAMAAAFATLADQIDGTPLQVAA